MQKKAWSLSFLVLQQHEQISPERLSMFAPFSLETHLNSKEFKDFREPTATFKDFQGLCEPCQWV